MTPNHSSQAENDRESGLRLRTAREAAGLGVSDVAASLRMPVRVIEALEAGEFERIGAPVFVRGQLRSYSRLLKLPVQPIQAASGNAPIEPTRLVPRTRTPTMRRVADQIGGRLVYIVITALIVLPVWVATRSHLGAEESAAPLDLPAGKVVSAQRPAAATAPAGEPATVVASMASLPPRQVAPADAPAAEPVVELRFDGDSWVQILAPDGRIVEKALLRAGDVRSYPAASVGRAVLGNATVVQVRRNGEQQDLAPFMRANVARFTVSSDGSLAPAAE